MAIETSEIIARLCRAAASHHFPLGAVRVQKLLYLIECEYFRWNQTRLTGEQWIYFHYGPWSPTLDRLLRERFSIEPELMPDGRQFNGIRYHESDFFRLPDRFPDFELQGIFERIAEEWLLRPLNELLDFVYFHTPPMNNVQRGQRLDFASIPPARGENTPLDFFALADRKRARKEKIKGALATWRKSAASPEPVRLPVDGPLMNALDAMERAEAAPPLSGEIIISGDDVGRLRGEVG